MPRHIVSSSLSCKGSNLRGLCKVGTAWSEHPCLAGGLAGLLCVAAQVSVCTAAGMSVGTPDRGPTRCNVKHKPRVSPLPWPSCGTSPEGQHGQGAVGLVAGVTAQPAAPEVMMPQVPQRRLCAEVLRATQQTVGSGLRPPPGQKPSLPHVSHRSWVQPPTPSRPAPAGSPQGSTVPRSACSPSDLSHPLREPYPFQDQADDLRGHRSWGALAPHLHSAGTSPRRWLCSWSLVPKWPLLPPAPRWVCARMVTPQLPRAQLLPLVVFQPLGYDVPELMQFSSWGAQSILNLSSQCMFPGRFTVT